MSSLVVVLGVVVLACGRKVDVAAEEQAIRSLDAQWITMIANADTTAIANLYAEDGYFLAPNAPRQKGRDAIRHAWASLYQLPGMTLHFEPDLVSVSASGDLAYELSTYHFSFDGPKGKIAETGKSVVVWHKVGSEWKVAADIYNADAAATGQ